MAEDDTLPQMVRVKPEDQLQLTPEELEKEVPARVLYAVNPQAAHNLTHYSFKDKCFKTDTQMEQTVYHLSVDGTILLAESEEAQEQEELAAQKREEQRKRDEQEAVDVEVEAYDGEEPVANALRNQFNFSERASQTFNAVLRTRGASTIPPATCEYTETVTMATIYDCYLKEIEAASKQKRKEGGEPAAAAPEEKKKEAGGDPLYSDDMRLSIKIMSRMVIQNAEKDVYHDFKYYEDPADAVLEDHSELLPLWRFSSERSKRKQVTAIKWNPRYRDLFCVGFGSYDFTRQGSGVICGYSLKNTSHPEYSFLLDSGVCTLDWHPAHPAMLAAGLYDGTVLVLDVRDRRKKPLYQSTVRTRKHTDPVWEVRWAHEAGASGPLSFYSVSSDGRVTSWVLMKTKLEAEEVTELKLVASAGLDDDETSLTGLAGGLCFDFNQQDTHLFLVGTEEGRIHKCSKAYSGQYLETYEGHSMAVYTVRWNPFHPRIFLSSSADWTVKMWDHERRHCVLSFDLAQAVPDAAWAPYSSTVLAAITSDGLVHIWDLNVNRNDRICVQKVVKRAKLTHVAFSPASPILLVGDDRGGCNCLKLSPNLRRPAQRTEENTSVPEAELQVEKMKHLLDMLRDR